MEITVMFKRCTEEKPAFQLCFLRRSCRDRNNASDSAGVSVGSGSFVVTSKVEAISLCVRGSISLF